MKRATAELPPEGGSHNTGGTEKTDQTGGYKTNAAAHIDTADTVCLRCGESQELAQIKGCIKCLKCGFKFDCNGW
jgi:hypothetical protein